MQLRACKKEKITSELHHSHKLSAGSELASILSVIVHNSPASPATCLSWKGFWIIHWWRRKWTFTMTKNEPFFEGLPIPARLLTTSRSYTPFLMPFHLQKCAALQINHFPPVVSDITGTIEKEASIQSQQMLAKQNNIQRHTFKYLQADFETFSKIFLLCVFLET